MDYIDIFISSRNGHVRGVNSINDKLGATDWGSREDRSVVY